jgi:aldose sugar dehydrogenase
VKKLIFILIISIIIIGYVGYANISLLPTDLINFMRDFRDTGQEIQKSIEKTAGVPLNAKVYDNNFFVEDYISGLSQPTAMTFVGNDILILEKNSGHVKLIRDDQVTPEPLLDFEVASSNESGLLGITSVNNDVYIYVTESENEKTLGNNIYRYTWDGNNLINSKLMNSLSSESTWHNGGSLTANLNGEVFAVIGDQIDENFKNEFRLLQNHNNGDFDDSGIIVRVGYDSEVTQPKFDENPLLHYYAIGIRNSFGLDVDPLTNNLWDTENGPDDYDEINFVEPGFNSGWGVVSGPITEEKKSKLLSFTGFEYSDPEFSWEKTIAPTGIEFVNSKLFSSYDDHILVGACGTGQLFKFKLNEDRNGFTFSTPHLQDLVANLINNESGEKEFESLDEIIFGDGFGCITDVKFGPDGFLYVVSITDNSIYRIMPIM